MRAPLVIAVGCAVGLLTAATAAQRSDAFGASRDHAAIAYSSAPVTNVITALNESIRGGQLRLPYDPENGYLRPLLDALAIPVE
jgi:hypothetical protein